MSKGNTRIKGTFQLEGSFTQVENRFLEALPFLRLSGTDRAIIDLVIRHSFGYHREVAPLTVGAISRALGIEYSSAKKRVRGMKRRGVLIVEPGGISIQRDPASWLGGIRSPGVQNDPGDAGTLRTGVRGCPNRASASTPPGGPMDIPQVTPNPSNTNRSRSGKESPIETLKEKEKENLWGRGEILNALDWDDLVSLMYEHPDWPEAQAFFALQSENGLPHWAKCSPRCLSIRHDPEEIAEYERYQSEELEKDFGPLSMSEKEQLEREKDERFDREYLIFTNPQYPAHDAIACSYACWDRHPKRVPSPS